MDVADRGAVGSVLRAVRREGHRDGRWQAPGGPRDAVRIRREFDEAVAEAEHPGVEGEGKAKEEKATKATAGRRVASFVAGTLDVHDRERLLPGERVPETRGGHSGPSGGLRLASKGPTRRR